MKFILSLFLLITLFSTAIFAEDKFYNCSGIWKNLPCNFDPKKIKQVDPLLEEAKSTKSDIETIFEKLDLLAKGLSKKGFYPELQILEVKETCRTLTIDKCKKQAAKTAKEFNLLKLKIEKADREEQRLLLQSQISHKIRKK